MGSTGYAFIPRDAAIVGGYGDELWSSIVPRFFFDFRTNQGVIERDATGVFAPDIGTALYGCIGAILEMIDDNSDDVERISVRAENGDLVLLVDLQALRAASAETE